MYKIEITGIVQGVGFRPYIYNSARKLNLTGTIQNTALGVEIICNSKEKILSILKTPPKLSKIDTIKIIKLQGNSKYSDFKILESQNINSYSQIPADLNLCKDCINELFNKKNPRYNYFFISCTNCGPRYSIIKKTPYDRKNTTLKKFKLCKFCKEEYENSQNRRYHAQTIACPKCGPELTLYKNQKKINTKNPIDIVSNLIKKNEIIAIKGTGGFHLVCNINNTTIEKLKTITNRHYKPFALMAKNISMIEKYCFITKKEEEILKSKERPIVLLEKKDKSKYQDISELSSLGFMLPSNPIQYLLFENIKEPLIFTSSNLPNKPITLKKEEQFVEYVLDYNRDIENFLDDSIIKVINEKPLLIRRSRGFAPKEINIPKNYQNLKENISILALGAELKNTICIKKENKLILSQHIGNTYNYENFENFKKTLNKLKKFTNTKENIILSDLNPSFNITNFAKNYSTKQNIEFVQIQHHIAHAFSCAIEHNLKDFIAIVADGTGYGENNTIWGGEIFHNNQRIGGLETQTLIGSDAANREPLRILIAILSKFLSEKEIINQLKDFDENKIKSYLKQKKENFNCIETSSMGRVLDAICVLLKFSDINNYEGRGAMLLESNSSKKVKLYLKPQIKNYTLQTTPLFKFIIENQNKISKEDLARFSQIYLAKGMLEIAKKYQKKNKLNLPILFTGGCAYNLVMTKFMIKNKVLTNNEIPLGDGGISAGQIAYYLWKNKN